MWKVPFYFNCDCDSVTDNQFYLFLYKAFQSFIKFAIHLEGIMLDSETRPCLHRPEVRVKRAVRPASDGDVLSLKKLRVALGARGLRLDEGEMLPAVVHHVSWNPFVSPRHYIRIGYHG